MIQPRQVRDAFWENPVFRRERAMLLKGRFWIPIVVVWMIPSGLLIRGVFDPWHAATWCWFLFTVQMLVGAIAAIAPGAASIAREKEQQTWEALVLTRLPAHEVVAGKTAAVTLAAALPSLPAGAAMVLLSLVTAFRGFPDPEPAQMLACEVLGICALSLQAALGVAMSSSAKRTSEAAAGAMVGALAVGLGLLRTLYYVATTQDSGILVAARVGAIVALACALCIRLLVAACEHASPEAGRYRRTGALASAACYLCFICLLCVFVIVDTDSWRTPLGVHAVLIGWVAAIACAGALPLRPAAGSGREPAWQCAVWLRYSLALHLGSVLLLLPCLLPAAMAGRAWQAPVWGLLFATTGLLLCGGFGCLVAGILRTWRPSLRAGIAAVFPLLLLCGGFYAAYDWGPRQLPASHPEAVWAASQNLNPVSCLIAALDPTAFQWQGLPMDGILCLHLPVDAPLQAALGATFLLAAHASARRPGKNRRLT